MSRLRIDPKEFRPDQMPRLERSEEPRPGIGIVHLGLGAFFRAHGAIYIEEAMAKSGGDWGILGVSLQSPTTRDALSPQGCAYTAVEKNPAETATNVSKSCMTPWLRLKIRRGFSV